MENEYNGALIDTRLEEEKLKDFQASELFASAPLIQWFPKAQSEWKKYSLRDQAQSGSCVAQTVAKMFEIMNYVEEQRTLVFSATPIYQKRSNKPSAGMIGVEAGKIACGQGTTLEVIVPSQKLNDSEMDAVKLYPSDKAVGQVFKPSTYYFPKNIDEVAEAIDRHGCVMLWFYCDRSEWTDVPTVQNSALSPYKAEVRHSVTGVDRFLYNGKKAILIDDSWGKFGEFVGQRIITEDFFNARNFLKMAFVDMKNGEVAPVTASKPRHTFTVPLIFGDNNEDVRVLQSILQYEGLFPLEIDGQPFSPNGRYGALTAKSVKAFQYKHNVASVSELENIAGRRVGSKTLAKLNELYGLN